MSDPWEKYDKELLVKIGSVNNWPVVLHQEEINRLFSTAFDAHDQKTSVGDIACVLIWHQVIEHLAIHLLELSYLYIQGELWPSRISLSVRGNRMYGYYKEQLLKTVDFNGKSDFIGHSDEFNSLRIDFVHKLALVKNEKSIAAKAERAHFLFTQRVLPAYQRSEKSLYRKLEDLSNRVDWNELLNRP